MPPLDRHHPMQPLAAGRAREARQAERLQALPQLVGRRNHLCEGRALGGIEIEHEPVWAVWATGASTALVQLDGTELHQGQRTLGIVDRQVRLLAASSARLDRTDGGRLAGRKVAQVEAASSRRSGQRMTLKGQPAT